MFLLLFNSTGSRQDLPTESEIKELVLVLFFIILLGNLCLNL